MAVPLAASVADPVQHDGLIAAHALSGAVAFALGTALALRPSRHPAQAMAYAVALTLMALFAVGAVALAGLPSPRASRELAASGAESRQATHDTGFTLITLFTGNVAVLAVWILAVVAGRRAVGLVKARRHPHDDQPGQAGGVSGRPGGENWMIRPPAPLDMAASDRGLPGAHTSAALRPTMAFSCGPVAAVQAGPSRREVARAARADTPRRMWAFSARPLIPIASAIWRSGQSA